MPSNLLQKHNSQRGASLIEVLVAFLLVSLGVLGVVGLQSRSNAVLGDTRYRVDAAMLADELISNIWSESVSIPGGGVQLPGFVSDLEELPEAWIVRAATLPGHTGLNQDPPIIQIDPNIPNQMTITICWQSPTATRQSCHSVVTVVERNA